MDSMGVRVNGQIRQKWRNGWAKGAGENASWITFVVFYGVLANVPYWIVSFEFGFSPLGCFCVEYAMVGLVALITPRSVAAISLCAVMILDLLCGIRLTYNIPIWMCLANARAAGSFAGAARFCLFATSLLTLLAVAAVAQPRGNALPLHQRSTAARCLVAFALLTVTATVIVSRIKSGYWPSVTGFSQTNDGIDPDEFIPRPARLPVFRLIRLRITMAKSDPMEKIGPAAAFPMRSATDIAIQRASLWSRTPGRPLPSIVQVEVESWGATSNRTVNDALVEVYEQPAMKAKYQVIQGSVPFYGPTIPGEGRELCDSQIGFHLITASAADLTTCLPWRLSALGYRTIGIHGMSGSMFDRSTWYRTVGFQKSWFREQLEQKGLRDCIGAFVGTCDEDIAAWIGQRLDRDGSQPLFMHWMTLNSHLPVPVPPPTLHARPCVQSLGIEPNSPLCSWYELIDSVHRATVRVALGPLARPTVFVIVGDHAPPFGDPKYAGRFSKDAVPYVVLVPRLQNSDAPHEKRHHAQRQADQAKLLRPIY